MFRKYVLCAVAAGGLMLCANIAHAQNGACCLDIDDGPMPYDTCVEELAADCGGIFQGAGTVCNMQACCMPAGFCQDADVACCLASGGTPQGSQTECATLPVCIAAPTGACCVDTDGDSINDACMQLTDAGCVAATGSYHGDGTPCQGSGACCFGITGGACVQVDGACCGDVAGFFHGVGSVCEGDANNDGIDDACDFADLCPIPDPNGSPDCTDLQATDCQTQDLNGALCMPRAVRVVAVPPGPDLVEVTECECFSTPRCGVVHIDGTELSCPGLCSPPPPQLPDPTCQIHVDGVAIEASQVDVTDLNPDSIVTCECVNVACCTGGDVTCFDETRENCLAFGGEPLDAGSSCLGHEACCLPDLTCSFVDRACCEEDGGTPGGPGTTCLGDGGCCCDIDAGSLQYDACTVLDEFCCDALGGLFSGASTVCEMEACCLPNASCQETDSACCQASGGTPGGAGSSCATILCTPQMGACCSDIDDGPLQYDTCTLTDELSCTNGGGVFQGIGSQCEVEGCCLPGGFCQNADPECCEASGGVALGAGQICGLVACDVGGCCFDIDDGPLQYDACTLLSQQECLSSGGAFQGPGSNCDVEACCLPGGFCQDADPECCIASGGSAGGADSTCAMITCVDLDGACCSDADLDGIFESCGVMSAAACLGLNGNFLGDGSACQGSGACCFGITGGACEVVDGACCDGLAGSFQGVGSVCLGDAGNNGLDDACEAPCVTRQDCCDVAPPDGIRDDNCQWCECSADGQCVEVDIPFADMGGSFGGCTSDGFCNVHDRTHALICFAGVSSCNPMNIDAGGPFGDCCPDGFCNVHDANLAMSCFASTTTCACPDACGGPMPEMPAVGSAEVLAVASRRSISAGDLVAVRAVLAQPPANLQSYQMHFGVSGGSNGALELVDISIEERRDHVFGASSDRFEAFNRESAQMLSGLSDPQAGPRGPYLATFTYQASADARGRFVVDVLHDESAGHQTYLVAIGNGRIAVLGTKPALIQVGAEFERRKSPPK